MEYDNLEIGKQEVSLQPARVKITSLEERDVEKWGKKLVLKVQHPNREQLEIGQARFENNGKLKTTGLWLKKDTEGKLQGNSAIAFLIRYLRVNKISDLVNKEIDTVTDEKGYLVAKAY
jgi:hypothetical protein